MTQLALQVENLHKSFGDLEVLKGVSMEARKGDVISLIGSSGSGKSTLLRCINLLESPTEGSIRVQGEPLLLKKKQQAKKGQQDLEAADHRQLQMMRRKLGFVFQNFNLWPHMSILDNLIEAPVHVLGISRDEAISNAERLLEQVGLLAKKDAWPVQLSGGQQQRAAIARALAMDPEIMLFDEPTSALDPELVGEVLSVIRDLAREGRTLLIVTHEMAFAREVSSGIVFLHQGRIEEQGTPEQVFNHAVSERCQTFLSSCY